MTASASRLVLWHRWFPARADDEDTHPAIAAWRRTVAARFQVMGGAPLGLMGASVGATFDPSDLLDVLTMCLDLLDEADAADPPLAVAFGAAIGALSEADGALIGSAIERAQNLAVRGREGELTLDTSTRDRAAEHFLTGRQVAAGAGSARGTTVDRRFPRRVDCAGAIAQLGRAALPPVIAAMRAEIERELREHTARTFILRGPVGAGASELIGDLERTMQGPQTVRVGAAPGGLVPLASLRLALLRWLGSSDPSRERFAVEHAAAASLLNRVAAGELVDLETLANALVELISSGDARPWVVLSPLSLVDGATLAVLLEARARGGDFVLFGRFPVDSALPRPLAALEEPVRELTLPPLKTSDARVVAEAIFGKDTPDEVTRRVAVLGGDTVLGVVEAARTLISKGDLVYERGRFVWRTGPRTGADAIGTEALMSERLEHLDGDGRRVLEALCVAPDGADRALIAEVAAHDGIGDAAFGRSLLLLTSEALARGMERPRPASSLLRWRVLSLIPPARAMELHRFVGEALRDRDLSHTPLWAQLGYYLVEGGLEAEGRPLMASLLEDVLECGYERAARQLSGWLATVGKTPQVGATRATPVPPPMWSHEEGPPSSEIALDELLEELAASGAPVRGHAHVAPRPPPPPPRRAAKPPPSPPPSPPPVPPPVAALDEEDLTQSIEEALFELGEEDAPDDLWDVAPAAEDASVPQVELPDPEVSTAEPDEAALDQAFDALVLDADDDLGSLAQKPPSPLLPSVHAAAEPLELDSIPPEPELAPPTSYAPLELDALDALDALDPLDAFAGLDGFEAPDALAPPQTTRSVDAALDDLLMEGEVDLLSYADEDEDDHAEATSVAPLPVRRFVEEAVRAVREQDYGALDEAIQRAAQEGNDLGALGRVRAIAELARGDLAAARKSLSDARPLGSDDRPARTRYLLAEALLSLRAGVPIGGVRAALAALAASRQAADARGEAASLHILAACYRALGRADDAARLEALV